MMVVCLFSFLLAYLPCTIGLVSTPIVACASGMELQRAISTYCRPTDVVLELGAQLSEASAHLCQSVQFVQLVDVKRSDARSGRTSYRNPEAFVPPAGEYSSVSNTLYLSELSDWREKLWKGSSPEQYPNTYDGVVVDLGHMIGNDLCLTTLSLANELIPTWQPRAILVKSNGLSSFARRLVNCQRILDGTLHLPLNLERSSNPYLIACVGVDEYRRTIPYTVREDDEVLEVGCHFGRTTVILDNAASLAVGVDIGPKIIANAMKQYPLLHFAVGDAWNVLDLLQLKQSLPSPATPSTLGYDVVYADIGGLSGSDGYLDSLALLDSLSKALHPRCIVIKSMCMKRLASQLRAFSEIWSKLEEDP